MTPEISLKYTNGWAVDGGKEKGEKERTGDLLYCCDMTPSRKISRVRAHRERIANVVGWLDVIHRIYS